MTVLKAIIIEDEPLARVALKQLLLAHPEVEVIGEAGSIDRAEALLKKVRPDVVFLDIQLHGGTGFDLTPYIYPPTEIIFFTAHDEYAVRAFEINALDYILKPVKAERLAKSINRLLKRSDDRAPQPGNLAPLNRNDKLFIKTEQVQRFVDIQSVLAVTAVGGNFTYLFLGDGSRYMLRRSLKDWEISLPGDLFFRIHRSTLINMDSIDRLYKVKGSSFNVCLKGIDEHFEVSQRQISPLKKLIKKAPGK